jgi:hypothetical protein
MDTEAPLGQRLVLTNGIILSKEKCSYTKATKVRDIFQELKVKYNIETIYIEENLQAFRRGLSSAKTLSILARFNGIISFVAQDIFQVPVVMLNVNHARKSIGLKTDRKIKQEISIKEQVVRWIKDQPDFKNFKFPMKTLKSGPRKGQVITAPEGYDIADAAVVCLAGMIN